MSRIVGSAAYCLKSDATKAREFGAKGIGARRNGRAEGGRRTGRTLAATGGRLERDDFRPEDGPDLGGDRRQTGTR